MGFFCEVLREVGCGAVVVPCCFVFFVVGGELSSCLSHIRFVAVWADWFGGSWFVRFYWEGIIV